MFCLFFPMEEVMARVQGLHTATRVGMLAPGVQTSPPSPALPADMRYAHGTGEKVGRWVWTAHSYFLSETWPCGTGNPGAAIKADKDGPGA